MRGAGEGVAPPGTHLARGGREHDQHQQHRQQRQQRGRPPRRPGAHGGRGLSVPACPGARRLSGDCAPCAARAGESGCEAHLASRRGAGFAGLSRAVPSLPTEAFDCGSKGGKKWLRSRPRPPLLLNSPGNVPPTWAFCPGGEKGLSACGAGGRGSRLRGEGGDAPKVSEPGRGRGVRVGGGEIWGCAARRRLSRAEGVASGRAQIKREARGASALGRPLWLPAAGGALSPLLSPARLSLAAAELGHGPGSAEKRQLSRAWIWVRGSREVCTVRAGDEAAAGAVGGFPR